MSKSYNIGTLKLVKFDKEKGASFKIEKSYKDKATDEWKQTDNLFFDDLLKLQALINKAVAEEITERQFNTTKPVEASPVKQEDDFDDKIPF